MSPGAQNLLAELTALPPATRAAALLRSICERSAAFLGRDKDDVTPSTSWVDLGFDSLRAVDFRSELEAALGLRLRSTLLFDQPTPQDLSDHLMAQLSFADQTPAAAATEPRAQGSCAQNPLPGSDAIAIVGAACRFPGGDGLEQFWQLLQSGGDAVGPIGDDRFDVDAHYDPDPNAKGKLYVREAGLLDDLKGFDAALFGISPREATMLDPQQRLLLETSYHALEHAGKPPHALKDDTVGVYIGTRASEYFDSQTNRAAAEANSYYATGNAVSTAAGRISFTFGFRGPCYALDTACSGSLVAVHNAVRALRAGECNVALAGGVNAIFDPVPMTGLCEARMLAKDGRCKAFDASADGYGRGEGCGMIVLKRLRDAQQDGDRILAVVRGSASNQDGRSSGLTVPHGPSQVAVIRSALADAGLQANDIDYVEAHGTGTSLGDPIEVAALDDVFEGRDRKLPVGTVKTNIGHLEAAAGISGLLKTVLALQHRELPKTVHFETPNPHIDWRNSVVSIVRTNEALDPTKATHFAGVSSFGFSGTNCHVVLSSPPQVTSCREEAPRDPTDTTCLLGLQAGSDGALRQLARRHAERLQAGPTDLQSWCAAAAITRTEQPHRAAFVATTQEGLCKDLLAFADGDDAAATDVAQAAAVPPRVAFLFPGQGSQQPGMGKELAEREPVFGDALQAAAERLAADLPAPLHELLWHDDGLLLQRTDVTQPALCSYQLAMIALLRSVGVVPDAALGHSVGDYAAAVSAGVLDGSDALRLCAARGRLMVDRCARGGLLAVLADLARFEHLLARHPDVDVAVHNAPSNHVIGGEPEALDALQKDLEAAGIRVRRLAVSHAFHTASTDAMLAPFAETFADVRLRAPQRTMIACATGAPAGAELATADFWVRHVREPVQFARGVQGLAATQCDFWLELGPTAMLSALAASNGIKEAEVVPLQRGQHPARATFLRALARLWTNGCTVDLAAANHCKKAAHEPHDRLPAYPFDRQPFWLEKKQARHALDRQHHALLGKPVTSSLLQPGQQLFSNFLSKDQPGWLADHVAFGEVLFPAAGMLECALRAEHLRGGQLPVRIVQASLRAPLMLDEEPIQVEVHTTSATSNRHTFSLKSLEPSSQTWRPHLDAVTESGTSQLHGAQKAIHDLAKRCGTPVAPEELYARCRNAELDYGERFRCVRNLGVAADSDECLAEVALSDDLGSDGFVLHPALLDGCFHTLFAVLPPREGTFLPIGVEGLTVARTGLRRVWCHTRTRAAAGRSRTADLDLYDEHGQLCAQVVGLQLVPADVATIRASASRQRDLLYHVDWDQAPASTQQTPCKAMAIVGDPELATALAQRLPRDSAHVCSLAELPVVLARQRIDRVTLLATAVAGDDDAIARQRELFGTALAVAQLTAKAPGPPELTFVTHGVQPAALAPASTIPHAASLLGLRRTIAIEHPQLRAGCIDLDPIIPVDDLARHAEQLSAILFDPTLEPEVAVRSGMLRVPRLRRGAAHKAALLQTQGPGPFRVRAKAYGQFDHLQVEPLARRAPGAGEVEVAMHAAALNFKDALHVLGMLREHSEKQGILKAADQPLGFEGSGIVQAVGEGVTSVHVGDRVVVNAASSLQSHVTVTAQSCLHLPEHIDLAAAAGLPTVFATVLHGLVGLAKVQAGEVVLVHAAAGGVGQAAIQLLRHLGCRVLATASPNKHTLVQRLGAEVVGNSRTAEFADTVRAATDGKGADVVLNTLSGDTVAVSFEALRQGGRFIELGKLGVWSAAQVEERRPDVTFHAFDMGEEFQRDAALQPRLMADLQRLLAARAVAPVPATFASLAETRDAFQLLAQGRHVGKLIVRMPRPQSLQGDRTYLITGGGGGIATAIAAALVAGGARHIALLARRELDPDQTRELHDLGATVHAVRADCTDRAELAEALRELRESAPPLGGIVHAAGSLADGLVQGLDCHAAEVALRPKIQGALLLDELTRADRLQFFVTLSSMAGSLGNAGQAAYAAANSFLDAFADWRRQRGLPASSLAYGPWHGKGMAARLDESLKQRLSSLGIDFLPATTASATARDLRDHHRNVLVMSIRWQEWLQTFGTQLPPMLKDMQGTGSSVRDTVEPLDVAALPAEEREPRLRQVVLEQVAQVLGFEGAENVDTERTFQEQGLDSLMAVDAKDRLETIVGTTLPATLLFDHPDVKRLVAHLIGCVCGEVLAAPDELEAMATDDIAKLLAEELGHDSPQEREEQS